MGNSKSRPCEVDRFWLNVTRGESDACWIWNGHMRRDGYGSFWYYVVNRPQGKFIGAHRYAYQLTHGPIPKGEGFHGTCVCHRCDVKRCVNPAHLYLGTQAKNLADARAKHRTVNPPLIRGERHYRTKLKAPQVVEMRQLRADGESLKEIAKRYGVDRQSVSQITRGVSWKHVGGPLLPPT